ncbi:hypothetical protein MUK42_21918, partial [Musa troglodytarum]
FWFDSPQPSAINSKVVRILSLLPPRQPSLNIGVGICLPHCQQTSSVSSSSPPAIRAVILASTQQVRGRRSGVHVCAPVREEEVGVHVLSGAPAADDEEQQAGGGDLLALWGLREGGGHGDNHAFLVRAGVS